MTRALALNLAPTRVNAAAPGLIDTPLWDAFVPQREAIVARGARCRWGGSAARRRWPKPSSS
jgi:NAD(P)-dependent dehydrogenase (short-subunit alcohol dehydrogenase family)